MHSEINIYTDGSKYTDYVGSGFVIYRFNKVLYKGEYKLPKTSSIFQAEIAAIREAIRYIKENVTCKYIRFFVDSQAAILALSSREVTSLLVLTTINELNKAAEDIKIIINWTKAHIGTVGNEVADTLAKAGAKSGVTLKIGLLRSELKKRVESLFYAKWERRFTKYKGCLLYTSPSPRD